MNKSSNYIPPELLKEIRAQNDIAEVISECGIPLRAAGREYRALCPFHEEQKPSFSVSPEKQIFYCFGCNSGGNVISFLQKHEGMSFIEAVEWLAERVGISLPSQDGKSRQINRKRVELQDLNRFALAHFHRQLLTPEIGGHALAYLKRRGVIDQTIRQFQLGYATRGRRDLVSTATKADFSLQQLIDAGLVKNDEQGPMDRFRERIIFPILDERGTPVGFGGRALSEETLPKYLNSPTTSLYDKSKTLYNLYNARQAIQKEGKAILVEGYFDAIMPYQADVKHVVASLGTAFSESHASLLNRFAEETIIVYDGDRAGFQATLRGLHILLKEGLRVRIALLPSGEDPDRFIQTRGVNAFNELSNTAMNLIEFQIQRASQQNAIRRVDVKTQTVKEIALTLSHIASGVELNEYITYAAQELNIERDVLSKELQRLGVKTNRSPQLRSPSHYARKASLKPRESIEWQLMESLIQSPNLIPQVKEQFRYQDFTHPDFAIIAQMLWEGCKSEDLLDVQDLIDTCTNERIKGLISNALLQRKISPNLKVRVEGCLKKLKGFLLWDIERGRRSTALTQGDDNIETLAELVELSNRRRHFVH